jgi:hypothetical protein
MKSVLRILSSIIFICLLTGAGYGQNIGPISASVHGMYAVPVGSLSEWFKPTDGIKIVLGIRSDKDMVWEGVLERVVYRKGNDGKGGLHWKDLEVKLELYGAGLQFQYYPVGTESYLQPSITSGATLYRWFAKRGEHGIDTLNSKIVPARLQNDWSFGFHIGAGIEVPVVSSLYVNAGVRYQIVIAELWPALALHLENVSGFQSLQASAGLKYEFEF